MLRFMTNEQYTSMSMILTYLLSKLKDLISEYFPLLAAYFLTLRIILRMSSNSSRKLLVFLIRYELIKEGSFMEIP